MASNVSATSLANRSLAALGGKAFISSAFPSDGSRAGDAVNLLFLPTYESLARCSWWNCFRAQTTLTLLGAVAGTPEGGTNGFGILPPQPWLYMYQVPSSALKCRAIIPVFPAQGTSVSVYAVNNAAPVWIRGMGQIPFAVAYATDASNNPLQVILTNQSQAQLLFTVDQPNPSVWDVQFQAAFVASLAAFLVPALAMNMQLMQGQINLAERIIAEARASDGNEGVSTQDHVPDFIRARSGGSGWNYNSTCWNGMGLDNMAWAGGV